MLCTPLNVRPRRRQINPMILVEDLQAVEMQRFVSVHTANHDSGRSIQNEHGYPDPSVPDIIEASDTPGVERENPLAASHHGPSPPTKRIWLSVPTDQILGQDGPREAHEPVDAQVGLRLEHPNTPLVSSVPVVIDPSKGNPTDGSGSMYWHLTLPFDLRTDPSALDNADNRELILRHFPDNESIATDGIFLYFLQRRPPLRPRPVTVAGLPAVILQVDDFHNSPVAHPRPAASRTQVAEELNGRDLRNFPALFERVREFFEAQRIPITEVFQWRTSLIIVLQTLPADQSSLIYMAGGLLCRYLLEEDMGRPQLDELQNRRNIEPTIGHPGDSTYYVLQPGIRVASDYLATHPGMYHTSTGGVLVTDGSQELLTVSSHSFPDGVGSLVFHPDPSSNQPIGEIVKVIPETDISLVSLVPSECFENTTFETDDGPQIPFTKLQTMTDHVVGPIFMDTPKTGYIRGTLEVFSFKSIPSDEPDRPITRWVFTIWTYLGQEGGQSLPRSVCGAPLFTNVGEVSGFFWYAPQRGFMRDWCAAISSAELVSEGFQLVGDDITSATETKDSTSAPSTDSPSSPSPPQENPTPRPDTPKGEVEAEKREK